MGSILAISIVVVDAIQIVAALFFFAIPFEQSRRRADWARGVFVLTALLVLLTGIIDFLRHRAFWMPSLGVQQFFLAIVPTLRGVAFGLILSLIFSGELLGQRTQGGGTPTI